MCGDGLMKGVGKCECLCGGLVWIGYYEFVVVEVIEYVIVY